MSNREALARTLLLMRDEVRDVVTREVLLAALTGTRVALVADARNIATHAAQTAFVTAAMLLARSGHHVYLLAPNIPLVGKQLPLNHGCLIEELLRIGDDMLPEMSFGNQQPKHDVDIAIGFGDTPLTFPAKRRIWINAEPWTGMITPEHRRSQWRSRSWPIGALASAALASAEAFKVAMHKLRPYARNLRRLDTVFAYTDEIAFSLAPPGTPCAQDVGTFDCISGGAIINAALYVLSRIPGVRGFGRVIEHDIAALTNLNRYMLLRRSCLGHLKADDLALLFNGKLRLEAVPKRFEPSILGRIAPLAPSVLVGVDHIPTRWAAQAAMPKWLGVGATTHWSAMASFHSIGVGCARCLHSADDPGDPDIPTVAFVSFWAGLLLAVYFIRHVAGGVPSVCEQQTYLTTLRPENPSRSPVPVRYNCPICKIMRRPAA